MYEIHPYFNDKLNKTTIQVGKLISNTTTALKFDSKSAKQLYAKDGNTVIGFNVQLAIISRLDSEPFFISLQFDNVLSAKQIDSMYSQVLF